MNIINSNTTGHSRPQERKFSNKLFIGLILAVLAAVVIFLLVGQRKDMKTLPTETETTGVNPTSVPQPVEEPPKN